MAYDLGNLVEVGSCVMCHKLTSLKHSEFDCFCCNLSCSIAIWDNWNLFISPLNYK